MELALILCFVANLADTGAQVLAVGTHAKYFFAVTRCQPPEYAIQTATYHLAGGIGQLSRSFYEVFQRISFEQHSLLSRINFILSFYFQSQEQPPIEITSDQLRSDALAKRELMPSVQH